MRTFFAVCSLLAVPIVATAQSHPLVGQWNLTYPTQVRGSDGAPTPITLKGRLVVTQVGDSLRALLNLDPAPGFPPRPEVRMTSVRRDGAMQFVNETEAKLSNTNDQLSRSATITYSFEATGSQLNGTIATEIPGVPDIPPRKLFGTRDSP